MRDILVPHQVPANNRDALIFIVYNVPHFFRFYTKLC